MAPRALKPFSPTEVAPRISGAPADLPFIRPLTVRPSPFPLGPLDAPSDLERRGGGPLGRALTVGVEPFQYLLPT